MNMRKTINYSTNQQSLTAHRLDQHRQLVPRIVEQRSGHVAVEILLLLAGRMQNGGQRQLRRCVQQARIGQHGALDEIIDGRAQLLRIGDHAARLDVDEKALDGPEWIVHGQIVVELLHEEQLIGQNDVHGFDAIAFDVGHELTDGHIELFRFARQIHARGSGRVLGCGKEKGALMNSDML